MRSFRVGETYFDVIGSPIEGLRLQAWRYFGSEPACGPARPCAPVPTFQLLDWRSRIEEGEKPKTRSFLTFGQAARRMLSRSVAKRALRIRPHLKEMTRLTHIMEITRLMNHGGPLEIPNWEDVFSPLGLEAALANPDVSGVRLGYEASASDIEMLRGASQVRWVYFLGSVASEFVANLGEVSHLEGLETWHCYLPDRAWRGLSRLARLRSLRIPCSNLGRGLDELVSNNSKLQEIDVSDAPCGGEALTAISGLRHLSRLSIGFARISDAACHSASLVSRPVQLDVSGLGFRDEDILRFINPQTIVVLNVEFTRATDALLEQCRDMPRLRRIKLLGANVSAKAVRQLQEARPELEIHY